MGNDEKIYAHQFITILTKLQQARSQASGKTLAQDLVRTFMVQVPSLFPCVGVRVFFNNWHYEHFIEKRMKLPALHPEAHAMASQVFKESHSYTYQKDSSQNPPFEEAREYLKQGITQIQIFPLKDVNQNSIGLVELLSQEAEGSEEQQQLLRLLIQQLSLFLESCHKSIRQGSQEKSKVTPTLLLGRLQQHEMEIKNLSEKLQENIRQAREREVVFYSLIRYFRDTVKMIDVWNYLKGLTPENELGRYDFQQHADQYGKQAFQFSELLLYLYKLEHQEFEPTLNRHNVIDLIHQALETFTQQHQQASFNVRTSFPEGGIAEAMLDSVLFRTAVNYGLEYLFLKISDRHLNTAIVIETDAFDTHVRLVLRLEPDPFMKQLNPQEFDFSNFMKQPLDEYSLSSLFLPFVKLSLQAQHGQCSVVEGGDSMLKIIIDMPV
ncbi:hypothetical protein WDW89_14240 [Deltaproteobacteria bacterium TL4]